MIDEDTLIKIKEELDLNVSYIYPTVVFTYGTFMINSLAVSVAIGDCQSPRFSLQDGGITSVNIQSMLDQLSAQFCEGYVRPDIPCSFKITTIDDCQAVESGILSTFAITPVELNSNIAQYLNLSWDFIYPTLSFAYTPPKRAIGIKLFMHRPTPLVATLCASGFTQIDVSELINALPEMNFNFRSGFQEIPDMLYQLFLLESNVVIFTSSLVIDPLQSPDLFVQNVATLIFHMRPNNKKYLLTIRGFTMGEVCVEVCFSEGYVVVNLEEELVKLGRYLIVPEITTMTFTAIETGQIQHTLVHTFKITDLGQVNLNCIVNEFNESYVIVTWDRFTVFEPSSNFDPTKLYFSLRDSDGDEILPFNENGELPSADVNAWGYRGIPTIKTLNPLHLYFLSVFISIGTYSPRGLNYIKGVSSPVRVETIQGQSSVQDIQFV